MRDQRKAAKAATAAVEAEHLVGPVKQYGCSLPDKLKYYDTPAVLIVRVANLA